MFKINDNLIILCFFVLLFIIITANLFITPIADYGLFLSGIFNVLSNYYVLLSILGCSLLLFDSENKSLFFMVNIFLLVFIITQISFNLILEYIFHYKIDLIFGFDRFPKTILYFINIFLGIMLWFLPQNILLKYLGLTIFSFLISLHVGLNDIELFSLKSFINYPGGNILTITILLGFLIYLLKFSNKKYILVASKIYGSWIIVIGLISCMFSQMY